MPTKRATRVTKLRVPADPEGVLAKLYPLEEDENNDRVIVQDEFIEVDGNEISAFDELHDEMPGCCGVSVVEGVNRIAPSKKEAYAAVHALYIENGSFGHRAATLATTVESQKTAADFFRANGWKEIPLGKNPNSGNQLTLWILRHN